jgi:acid phosphatase type 7
VRLCVSSCKTIRLARRLLLCSLFVVLALLFRYSSPLVAQDAPPSPVPADGSLIGKPYLQLGDVPLKDSSARVDVVWHAAVDGSRWQVEYKEANRTVWTVLRDPKFRLINLEGVPAHRIYSVTLSKLVPGESFDYRLLRNDAVVFEGKAVAKNSDKQPYRFMLFGDCGANTSSQRKIAYEAYLAKPNFVFIPGDIVYGGGRIFEYRTNFFSIYQSAEASPEKGAPLLNTTTMIAAPGNHDTEEERDEGAPDVLAYFLYWDQPLNGPSLKPGGPNSPTPPEAKFDAAFEAGAGKAFPTMENFSFDWGNSHWTVLDSNDYVDWNDPKLRKWVENDLKSARNKEWHFVAFHHPGFSSSKAHFNDQWMRTLSDVFEAGKVDIVFAGHVHNYQRSLPFTFQIAESAKPGKTEWKNLVEKPIDGTFTLEKEFDGVRNTHPKGVIYIVSGAGGQSLYDPAQEKQPETWQEFTAKFVSSIHSFTLVDIQGGELTLRQISENGDLLDRIRITKGDDAAQTHLIAPEYCEALAQSLAGTPNSKETQNLGCEK